ncbi:MAG: PilZ domain-containing protein [Nitrospirota bacterium]
MGRERGYQRHPRFTKRLEVRFTSGGLSFTGILSNLSENGLFIRTNRGFAPGATIDIELVMPDGKVSFLKGHVIRTVKTPIASLKNGMGVELIEKDATYINFLKSFVEEKENYIVNITPQEFQIISCPNCGVKNKVSKEKLPLGPKCGRCGTPLTINMP